MRVAETERMTTETQIKMSINLDGEGKNRIDTGVGFFNHMLQLFARHGEFDLECSVIGDLDVDAHHTVEDTGIVLGTLIKQALGDKKGIKRYGTFYVPMMETLTRVSLDISNRGFVSFNGDLKKEKAGEFDTELTEEFFYSVAYNAGINMHIDVIRGENTHHIIESIFKAFARALKEAVKIEGDKIPSTKGVI